MVYQDLGRHNKLIQESSQRVQNHSERSLDEDRRVDQDTIDELRKGARIYSEARRVERQHKTKVLPRQSLRPGALKVSPVPDGEQIIPQMVRTIQNIRSHRQWSLPLRELGQRYHPANMERLKFKVLF